MANESDRLLVQQIRDQNPQAWQDLIARYEGRITAFIARRIKDRSACEDLVQETFIGFLTSLPNYDDRRELQTYLFTIASHKLTDHLRRTGRHPLHQAPDGPDDPLHKKPDPNPAASSVARGHEKRDLEDEAVARAISQLLESWRDKGDYERIKVLELLFAKGWANRDVASFLKISEQQVANIRFAAVRKIAEHVRLAGLPGDVFPELQVGEEA
ncbi:MAG: sigma-70 family RNA polymerase sigma factor [Gemmataceae bacterium]